MDGSDPILTKINLDLFNTEISVIHQSRKHVSFPKYYAIYVVFRWRFDVFEYSNT